VSREGDRIRKASALACSYADAHSRAHPGDGWYDDWGRRHTDADGYFAGWSGAPMTWGPYWDLDYFGVNARHGSGLDAEGKTVSSYTAETDVEKRLVLVDPMTEVPDNAHWKGWVW
jgi:hypothetical protein